MKLTAAQLQDLNGKIGREMTAACKDPSTAQPRLKKVLELVADAIFDAAGVLRP